MPAVATNMTKTSKRNWWTRQRHYFKKVDKDQDKKISRKKHDNSSLTSYGVPFEKFDVNEDQYVSLEEYKNQMGESHNIGAKKV